MTWPGEVIFKRVRQILADGVITAEECAYMQKTLTVIGRTPLLEQKLKWL
jgi:hypothetical protein